ncbi:unnamed protein product [Phytophthora fragariaefolia]|uniref:Unnamed protein product n=1 Tax=Phytophthora fragariaefolia TaxID=1490495 RepID=A0A9W6Y441_9STRA|nr:unnamed protein product [Phytophthora fragariaefolia]
MTCFPVWSTLQPFAALAALRYPELFVRALQEHSAVDKRGQRANCDFAVVAGIWRLVEELSKGDKERQDKVTHVVSSLLGFASAKLLFCKRNPKDEAKMMDAHLDDQLLEKFFTGLQAFSFTCWRAHAVLKQTLADALRDALAIPESRAKTHVVPQRIAVFTAAASMLVKDLAADVVSMLLERIRGGSEDVQRLLLPFLIGFCAHLDLVPVPSVLELLDLLVTLYKAVPEDAGHPESQRQRRLEFVFYIMYIALHRCQAVDTLRKEVSSEAAAVKERLSQFQMRLCGEIVYEDFYVAAPVHWIARVWKHWVFLSDEDVQAFVSDAHDNDNETQDEFKARVAAWKAWEALVAFRPPSFGHFSQMKALLKPHLISSSPLTDAADEHGLVMQARKRRRTEAVAKNAVDPEKLERSFDVLLLPDVMERVCSFMSAKRLCRMALVCRDFAALGRRASLWRPLYLRMGFSSITTKRAVLPPAPVECAHGDSYAHDWRQLYQSRWKVLRRLRRSQRRAIEAAQSEDRESESPDTCVPQICSLCGCDQVFKNAGDLDAHLTRHRTFSCVEPSCGVSFLGPQKLQQHMREHAAAVEPTNAPRLACGYRDCKKTYATARGLSAHCQKQRHYDSSSETSDAD